MKMQNTKTFTAALALFAAVGAQAADGYLVDSRGQPVQSGDGLCWRTAGWTPAHATAACDADLLPTPPKAARNAAPEPMPLPARIAATIAAPMHPQHQRVVLATDALFDFDRAELRPQGRAKLDVVAQAIVEAPAVEAISVIGHADRLGDADYNHALSHRRAEAVTAYLVERGVKAGWIRSAGQGESAPLTAADACRGTKKTAQLIACLQPDRRVEVEVVMQQPR